MTAPSIHADQDSRTLCYSDAPFMEQQVAWAQFRGTRTVNPLCI